MMKKRLLVTILFFAFFRLSAQKADSILSILAAEYPAEKVYIHYDKEYYVAGETIWFKAYLYSNGKPSGRSSNFYLQFMDSAGTVISSKKYPVLGAVAKGNLDIPDSLPQGNYFIRALTTGMLQEEESMIYKKNLYIFHPETTKKFSKANDVQTVSLKFFPESGTLVHNIITVVGFEAMDQYGIPVAVSGTIRTEDSITIASFSTYHDGIGKVQFKPQEGKKYFAEVETAAGMRIYALPAVEPTGVNLKIQDEKKGKRFQLERTETGKTKFDQVSIIAEINNQVVYETDITFENYPSVIGHLITDNLPSGILHFTVFNKDGLPLAERLTFVDNGEYRGKINLSVLKEGLSKRAENQLEVNFPDSIQRSCSVSVTDYTGESAGDMDHIISRLILTSDLKGKVYNPAWYFRQQNDSTHQGLDNLMLTHGWSRYNWKKLLAGNFPEMPETNPYLISYSGVVNDPKTNNHLSNGKLSIYLEAEDSTTQTYQVSPDDNGGFRLDSLLFYGKAKLFYSYIDRKGKQKPAVIIPDSIKTNPKLQRIPPGGMKGVVFSKESDFQNKNEINKRISFVQANEAEIRMLENIDLKSRISKKPFEVVNEQYTNGVFREPGKINLDNINEPANDKSMNAVDYIKNRIQQLELQGGQFVNRKNISLMTGKNWAVGVFLNEQPVTISLLRTIQVKDLALVKFFEAGFLGVGSSYPGGAIAVYTTEKDSRKEKPAKLDYVEYNGYSVTKQFYAPDYSIKETKFPESDYRTTLYWNPDLITDSETQSVKLNFYNNDFSKKLKVVVEGFDAEGKLLHLEKIIGN